MTKLINFLQTWMATRAREDRGITMVEYAIMAALIAVALIAALGFLTPGVIDIFTDIGTRLTNAL